ncbi:hypothetical protein BGZ49_005317 [Haplosporangium sp. Z 27]|nr:hypothetical protein BGZ49_005317 [Haplosporangium sp. Z 27]
MALDHRVPDPDTTSELSDNEPEFEPETNHEFELGLERELDDRDYDGDRPESKEGATAFMFEPHSLHLETSPPSDATVLIVSALTKRGPNSSLDNLVMEEEPPSLPAKKLSNDAEKRASLLADEILEAQLNDYNWIKSMVDDEIIKFIEPLIRAIYKSPIQVGC